MKQVTMIAVVTLVLAILLVNPAEAQFKYRGVYLGPNLTLATDPIGFGADLEFALSQNFGLGGLIRYWGKSFSGYGYDYSWSYIVPQVQGAYHFMPNSNLDPYLGARLGYVIASWSGSGYSESASSDLYVTGCGGMRYFFNPNLSLHGSIEFRITSYDYVGGLGLVAGVDFTL